MSTTTWRALLAMGMAITAGTGLAACGGGGSDDGASATTTAVEDGSSGTTAETADPGEDATTVPTETVPVDDDQPGCEEIEALASEIEGAEPTSSNDIGGLCEFRFGENSDWPGYSVLWNYGAVDRVQFESMRDMLAVGEMEQQDGPGTEFWVEVDEAASSTHAYVWVEGAGTWDLTYVRPFDTAPEPGDVDKLKQLGEQLTS